MSIFKKHPGGSAAEVQAEAQREEGSALDAETLMRKFDKESNTRIWEGTPAIIVRVVVVAFSLYCIWSTLFSVAALEKRLTMFMALVIIMGYLTYPASRHHVRHNYIPWFDFVLMAVGAGCFMFFCLKYDSLVKVLTSASKMTPTFTIIGIVGLLCLMELCRRCVGVMLLAPAWAAISASAMVAHLKRSMPASSCICTTWAILWVLMWGHRRSAPPAMAIIFWMFWRISAG